MRKIGVSINKQKHLVCYVIIVSFLWIQNAYGQQNITPETALKSYLNNKDNSYKWSVQDSIILPQGIVYDIKLISQTWKNIVWTHQLTVIIPNNVKQKTAMLFITGGRNEDGEPRFTNIKKDGLSKAFGVFAIQNNAITAILHQTPNQPLYGSKTEDELISYTLHNYKQDKDYEWPLLFPMVKSAVKAMDVMQELSHEKKATIVDDFVVSGASKRGWTTWLTGASDTRVKAIAPMVIDILNMPISLQYQIESWGDYSIQIQDYVNLGIPQSAQSASGQEITAMVDPYSYKKFLTMPKMLFMGTNDEYWVVDNVKNYLSDIPGDNVLHYVPNVGHSLGGRETTVEALSAFFATTANDKKLPVINWKYKNSSKKSSVEFHFTTDELIGFDIWQAESRSRDLRKAKWELVDQKVANKKLKVDQKKPMGGYKAFYVDFKYKHPIDGYYTVSSRIFLMDSNGIM